jgi:hypothetical protein
MSVSSSIKIQAARSSLTWINFHLDYTAGYPIYAHVYHNGPSHNGSYIKNCNNKHLLKEDFGTSLNGLHMVESNYLRYVNRQCRQK